MNSEEIKKDPIIKSILDEGGLEKPSRNFTNQIINTIKAQSKDSVFVYKPVISRSAWLVLAFLGAALFIYLLLGLSPEGQFINFNEFALNIDTSKIKGLFSKIVISFEFTPILKTSLIALTFFTFSNLIIFELKNRSFFK